VSLTTGNALQVPSEDASFDVVWMQHVAMNIAERDRLYRKVYRLLKQGGRFAFFDVVAREGQPHFPVPRAFSAETNFLLTAEQTRDAIDNAGFSVLEWQDDTALAIGWIQGLASTIPTAGTPNLGAVLGPDFPQMIRNLGRNLVEGSVGVLSAVVERPR
jgi:SAM-dependent methyltransferase